jgi:HSP20 family molecular chaperone IbpA
MNQQTTTEQVAHDERDRVVRPAVDVFEDEGGITVQADLPGVGNDGLNVHVKNSILTIEGRAKLDQSDRIEPLYAELQSPVFQRSFTLSSELDVERIDARLSNGVLTVTIPKRVEARPRRIEVRAA